MPHFLSFSRYPLALLSIHGKKSRRITVTPYIRHRISHPLKIAALKNDISYIIIRSILVIIFLFCPSTKNSDVEKRYNRHYHPSILIIIFLFCPSMQKKQRWTTVISYIRHRISHPLKSEEGLCRINHPFSLSSSSFVHPLKIATLKNDITDIIIHPFSLSSSSFIHPCKRSNFEQLSYHALDTAFPTHWKLMPHHPSILVIIFLFCPSMQKKQR